ncbi:hypothetical protein [Sphingomonas sp.]|uniref:hypothetical protein n=1 Tax=Sphingomonas sp. TaxID=28214 RepID=UPI003D6D1D3E
MPDTYILLVGQLPADRGVSLVMARPNDTARDQFRRMMIVITVVAVVMVAGALYALSLNGPLTIHLVVATIAGVFLSVLLGCGLFAAAFFSDKSGHDQSVTDATSRKPKD